MQVLGKNSVFLTQHIRNLCGGSQPILAQASDGHTYVVKFANNPQGPNLLFNESAGSELYRACGLPVPEWTPLEISEEFLDKNPDCWMQTPEGGLRPVSGLCFGSRFLGEGGKRLLEILPGSSFKLVRKRGSFWLAWLIDICAEHGDNRQAIFAEDAEGWLDAYFVDQGHFFGGPKADLKKNFHGSRYLDSRIYGEVSSKVLVGLKNVIRALDTDTLRLRVGTIPADWSHVSAHDSFERCLERLANPTLVQNVFDTIVGALENTSDTDARAYKYERKPPVEVLRLGIQGAGGGESRASYPACA
jgi:hypothetical protein